MRGRRRLALLACLAALGLSATRTAAAQEPSSAAAPPAKWLVAAGNTEVPSQVLAKDLLAELNRRGQPVVTDAEGARLLGRPLAEAVRNCSGDDLCFAALGQVVRATHVVVGSAVISPANAAKYECAFRVVEIRTSRVKNSMRMLTLATGQGLLSAARSAVELIVPRPAITAVVTPTPLLPAPTPTVVADAPAADGETGTAEAGDASPEPPANAAVPGLDAGPETAVPPRPRRGRPPLARDPAFWGIAGAGLLVLGVGTFFGAAALREEPAEERGESTVEVRF